MKKLLAAVIVFAASTAWAQEEPPQVDDEESLMCLSKDDADSCGDVEPAGDELMSTQALQLTCQQCASLCHGTGNPCFNCCCLGHC